ncbi:MAG: quinone-dependent dihydroorotate dehydrogenase [Bacteroidota bacterium]
MYRSLIRPFLFRFDPERIHNFTFGFLKAAQSLPFGGSISRMAYRLEDPALEKEIFGLKFKNPVGLAAGFDKDAKLLHHWRNFGFGFVEFGTVTPRPQGGNPKQRLFRLPKDMAIINRMGFNNAGVDAMVKRLQKMKKGDLIVGANIGKNKDTPNEKAVEDYLICFEKLYPYADYFVVNVSSPNTPGLRSLQEKGPLTNILSRLQEANQSKETPRPILLKIAPDLTNEQLDDIIEVAETTKLAGLIANNTTISRKDLATAPKELEQIGNGGLSGQPLTHRSWEVLHYIHEKTEGKLPLIGVGGIMEPLDAKMRFEAGASLIQIYSGYVYQGPSFVKRLLRAINW